MTPSDHTRHEFTDADWLSRLEALDIPHLNEWMRSQAKRGQDYYLRRLDRLGFSGGTVLDAGCGVGNWSIALARRFQHVEALDNDPERVGVLAGIASHVGDNLNPKIGSVTELPYEAGTFDAVFCNGVVFLTDTETALSEFSRVLRPGGTLYVTYNGPNWWRHLIRDRAPTEPVCYMYGANGLVTWAFRLAGELDLFQAATEAERDDAARELLSPSTSSLLTIASKVLQRVSANGKFARRCKDIADCIRDLQTPGVEQSYIERVAVDLGSYIATGTSRHEVLVHTYTHRPEDMVDMLSRRGMFDIMSAHEGSLCLNQSSLPVAPIYTPNQGVFETVARKS